MGYWEVEASCGHGMPLTIALKASTEKLLICESCFLEEKRKKQIRLIANGRRFRYTMDVFLPYTTRKNPVSNSR